jgi:hypothetical protein
VTTSRLKQYAGVCIGGPYDGQSRVHDVSFFDVEWYEGWPGNRKHGRYEFIFRRWFWKGPRYKPADEALTRRIQDGLVT